MTYTLTWDGAFGSPMRAELPSAEETLQHAVSIGAPQLDVRIMVGGQILTFDELQRIVVVSRRA